MVKNYNQITKLHFHLKIGGFLLGLARGICFMVRHRNSSCHFLLPFGGAVKYYNQNVFKASSL